MTEKPTKFTVFQKNQRITTFCRQISCSVEPRSMVCLKCEHYKISSPSSKIALGLTGIVLLLSCRKRKFPISFLCLCGPNLNPVDCKIWSLVQERVYQQPINNIDELRERIVAVWEAVEKCVIDAAIRQWRERLLACVKAKGGHFEHLLK